MRIIRVKNTIGIDMMEDKLIECEEMDREHLAQFLRDSIRQQADELCVLQAWDGDVLQAYLVAFRGCKHVFIYQAWSVAPVQVGQALLGLLKLWAEEHGLKELRFETARCPKAFFQRWKFVPHSTVMKLVLEEETPAVGIFPTGVKEDQDGRDERTENQDTDITDGSAASSVRGDCGDSAEDGTGRDSG